MRGGRGRRAVIWLALAEIVNALHIGAGVAVEELFEERLAGDFEDADVFDLVGDLGGGFLRTEGEGKERERQGCADRHVQLLYANEGVRVRYHETVRLFDYGKSSAFEVQPALADYGGGGAAASAGAG